MIWLVLFLALFLRLINLNQSLWLDEAINIVYAKSSDFWWFVTKYPIGDFHPPGWFTILWIWGHSFGFSEITIRLPSVILGILTVGLTFLIGRKLFNKKVGLISALLLAISPLHVYYSQEARMYALAAFSVTLSFYFLNGILNKEKWSFLGYVISLVLVLYSDYLSILVIPAQITYIFWIRKMDRKLLVSYLIAGGIFLPWFSILPLQLQRGLDKASTLPGWSNVVGGGNIKELLLIPLKIFFGKVTLLNKALYFAIAVFTGLLFGLAAFNGLKKLDPATRLLISWVIIPILLALIVSFFIPVLSYFRMLFILPAFYLLIAKGIESLPKKINSSLLIVICLVSLASVVAYYVNPKFQRENWREAISFIKQNLDNQTLVLFESDEIPAPSYYYANDISNFKPGVQDNLEKELVGKKKVFLFEYLVDIYDSDRSVEQKLRSNKFKKDKTYDFPGVGFIILYNSTQ